VLLAVCESAAAVMPCWQVGEGAVHIAARYNHISVLQYLCDAGADVNLQDKVC